MELRKAQIGKRKSNYCKICMMYYWMVIFWSLFVRCIERAFANCGPALAQVACPILACCAHLYVLWGGGRKKMTLIYITFIIVNQFSRVLFLLYDRGLAMPLGYARKRSAEFRGELMLNIFLADND